MNESQRLSQLSAWYIQHLERLESARSRFLLGEVHLTESRLEQYACLSKALDETQAVLDDVWRRIHATSA